MIYLDYASSTPIDTAVLDLFYDISKKYYANPNSSHKLGVEERNLIELYTSKIAQKLKCLNEEIIYTSGASESNNLAIKGICERYKSVGKHIIISSIEHNSIVSSCTDMQELGFEITVIPIQKDGIIDVEELKKSIRNDTILVSVSSVDSELGIKQPIEQIGKLLQNYPNCHFHTDASQAIGKIDLDYSLVDLITIAPHKFYGLNSSGALIKKKGVSLKPQISGGKSITMYRSGTPDLASVAAFSKALEIAIDNQKVRYKYVEKLHDMIKNKLLEYDNVHINSTDNSIPYILNFSIIGTKSLAIQKKLEENEIYVSTKTSCCPIETPSKIVYALTQNKKLSVSSIRLSLSHLTKESEIEDFLKLFDSIYKEYEVNGKI